MFTCTCTFFNVQFKCKYWNVHTVQYTWNTTNSTYQHMDITYLYLCMIGVSNTILYHFPISILHCVLSCAVQDSRSHHHRHSHHHHHSSASQGSHRHTRWVCTCIPVCYIHVCMSCYLWHVFASEVKQSVSLFVSGQNHTEVCPIHGFIFILGHLQAKMYVCLRPFLLLCSPYNSLAWDLKC